MSEPVSTPMRDAPYAPEARDIVRLRAIFVPDGFTPPAELLAGMGDVVRLNVRLPLGAADQGAPDTTEETSGTL